MPQYRVNVTYDMGFSNGGETIQFEAKDDEEAKRHVDSLKGSDLSRIKRDVRCDKSTLSRVIE